MRRRGGVASCAFVDVSGGFVNRGLAERGAGATRMYTISRSAESPRGRCSYPDYINQDSEGPFSHEVSQVHAVRARRHNADWKLRRQLFVRLRKARWGEGGRQVGGSGSQGRLNLRRNPSRYLVGQLPGAHKSGNFTERP